MCSESLTYWVHAVQYNSLAVHRRLGLDTRACAASQSQTEQNQHGKPGVPMTDLHRRFSVMWGFPARRVAVDKVLLPKFYGYR